MSDEGEAEEQLKALKEYQHGKEDSITAMEYCIVALLLLFLFTGLFFPFVAQSVEL